MWTETKHVTKYERVSLILWMTAPGAPSQRRLPLRGSPWPQSVRALLPHGPMRYGTAAAAACSTCTKQCTSQTPASCCHLK